MELTNERYGFIHLDNVALRTSLEVPSVYTLSRLIKVNIELSYIPFHNIVSVFNQNQQIMHIVNSQPVSRTIICGASKASLLLCTDETRTTR